MTSAVVTCVHAGRRVKKNQTHRRDRKPQDRARTHRGKGWWEGAHGVRKKKRHPATQRECTARGHAALSEQAAGERIGAIGA